MIQNIDQVYVKSHSMIKITIIISFISFPIGKMINNNSNEHLNDIAKEEGMREDENVEI